MLNLLMSLKSEEEAIEKKIQMGLTRSQRPTFMPDCADFMMAQITAGQIKTQFDGWFTRNMHNPFLNMDPAERKLVDGALNCTDLQPGPSGTSGKSKQDSTHCCIPCSCVTLNGIRRLDIRPPVPPGKIRDIFAGDLAYVFYYERFGIFKILKAILDDAAYFGSLPISNGNLTSLIISVMEKQRKMGLEPSEADKEGCYIRVLGWKQPEIQRKLDEKKLVVGNGFNNLFHRLLIQQYRFMSEHQVATVVGTGGALPPVQSVVEIANTVQLLQLALKSFDYGLVRDITLRSIVWILATIQLIYELKDVIGIPQTFNTHDQVLEAAYYRLVANQPMTPSESNRWVLCDQCAVSAQRIILDVPYLNASDPEEIRIWSRMSHVQNQFLLYRSAYRGLTGIDLGLPEYRSDGKLKVEQQVPMTGVM